MKFWIKTLKLLNRIFRRPNKLRKMYNLKRRRESVATVYKKTTKFLTSNTVNLLKKMPNTRKYHLLAKIVDDHEEDKETTEDDQSDVSDYGDRELDYYLGVRKKETYWRDPMGIEQVRKDYLLYHCGVSEEEYAKLHKKTIAKPSYVIQPRLKQVPFKIHKKNKKLTLREGSETWRERRNIFRIFANKRDTESTSDSYSECDDDDENADVTKCLNSLNIVDTYDIPQGVRIKEVSEGRPCDNCPELCPGFISHPWRHENCPWEQALKSADVTWSGLKYTCLKILHLYCKVFEREDVLDLLIRKTCKSCGCDRLKHSVYHEELCSVRDRLGLRETRSHHAYDNSPPGLTAKQTELYWSSLAERAPTIGGATGTAAWRAWRTRALATQLPKQDLSLAHCSNIDESHHKQFEDFVAARNEIALDIGIASQYHGKSILCYGCLKQIRSGSIVIQAPKLEEEEYYHPSCFTCSVCEELLVELAYCALDGRLFCVRHYDERLKPRCHACDELIFSSEYTKAMNKDWHSGHFCCWQCDESLTGQRYVLRDENPYCIKCYESAFANGCEECNKTIGIDSKDLSYKDKHWHEACFLCAKCRVSLVDKQFGSKHDKIYCGNCYDAQFASRCDGCGEVFRAGTKKMEYKTRQWHEKCFCCVVCKNPIGTKSFIPREQEIYCAGCYEDKFATRCVKCNKIITQGGVTYKNEPWHRECFTCTNCDTPLAGQRFTSRDEKPYCAECFGELFAKRCTSCTKPITGIGGTRFISFEDRHWHNHCFICAQCQTSLVGKGFITGGPDIICPECAKQKLIDNTVLPLVANARDWIASDSRPIPGDFSDLTKTRFRKVNPKPSDAK